MESLNDVMYNHFDCLKMPSVLANGKVANPGSGAAIVTTSILSKGIWNIDISSYIRGTTVSTLEMDNMVFKIGSTDTLIIINPVTATTGAVNLGKSEFRINITTPSAISVNAISAATTGATYAATIIATKVLENVN